MKITADSRSSKYIQGYAVIVDEQGRILADTMNCHYAIDPVEQRKFLETLVDRYTAHDPIVTALIKLANEVLAAVPLYEPQMREVMGHTNYNILVLRANQARSLLTTNKGEPTLTKTIPADAERMSHADCVKIVKRPSRYAKGLMASVAVLTCPACSTPWGEDYPVEKPVQCSDCGLVMQVQDGGVHIWRADPTAAAAG